MKVLRKQSGYTLLLTLVLIVLLFLLTASFTVASMNQTKQIKSTDSQIVASSLSEMGVELISARQNHIIETNQQTLVTKINTISKSLSPSAYKAKVDQEIASAYSKTVDEIIQLHSIFQKEIGDSEYYKSQLLNASAAKKIELKSQIEQSGVLTDQIIGVTNGNDNQLVERSIEIQIAIPKNLGLSYAIESSQSGQQQTTITFTGNESCSNCSKENYVGSNGSAARLTGDLKRDANITFGQLGEKKNNQAADVDGRKIISTKTINFAGNLAYVYNSSLYSNTLSFSNNSNSHHNNFFNTKLYTRNFIRLGNLSKEIHLNSSSKICIANYTNELPSLLNSDVIKIDSTSGVYVFAPNRTESSLNRIHYTHKTKFEANCNATVTVTEAVTNNEIDFVNEPLQTLVDIKYN